MPIYLCQPGLSTKEPWRHGIQVYARPFPTNTAYSSSPSCNRPPSSSHEHHQHHQQQHAQAAIAAVSSSSAGERLHRLGDSGSGGPNPGNAPEQIVVILPTRNCDDNNSDDHDDTSTTAVSLSAAAAPTPPPAATNVGRHAYSDADADGSTGGTSGSNRIERRHNNFIMSLLQNYLNEHLSSSSPPPPTSSTTSTTTSTITSPSQSLSNGENDDRVLIFCPPSTADIRSEDNNTNEEEDNTPNYCEWIARTLVQDGYRAIALRGKDTTTTISSTTTTDNAAEANKDGGEERLRDWEYVVEEFISGRSNIVVVEGGGVGEMTMAEEERSNAVQHGGGKAEEFIRGKILAASTIAEDQTHPSDDDDEDDSDSSGGGAVTGGSVVGGPFLVHRRRMHRRQEHPQHPQPKIDIAMVINLDLSHIDIRRYSTRLFYTKKLVVSLFHPSPPRPFNNTNEDTTTNTPTTNSTIPLLSVKDLVGILRKYRQNIPGELLSLAPPPPLMSPNRRYHRQHHRQRHHHQHRVGGVGDALSVVGGGGGGGDAGDEVGRNFEVGNDGEDDNMDADNDEDDYEDGPARMRSTTSQRRQQYLHTTNNNNIRNTTTMVRSHSSSGSRGDDDDFGNDGNNDSERFDMLQSSSSRVPMSQSGYAHFLPAIQHVVRPNPVRRLRHAEVVLVDQCLTAYGKTWLRLRWPGELGGFAGFVAVGGGGLRRGTTGDVGDSGGTSSSEKKEDAILCQEVTDPASSAPTAAMARPIPPQISSLSCPETNEYYPTSLVMKLLPLYDDGLSANQIGDDEGALMGTLVMDNGEPVFCRICREGLHDVDYGLETATPASATLQKSGVIAEVGGGEVAVSEQNTTAPPTMASAPARSGAFINAAIDAQDSNSSGSISEQDDQRRSKSLPTTNITQSSSTLPSQQSTSQQLLVNLPPLVLHHPTAENPLLAPCDCTGSMAFVHYLCVEQWRCRSRHPGARNGLNCETCGAEYTLPPPPSRPASRHDGLGMVGPNGINVMAEDEWLDAMPPHVLAALRRPHPAWQLGAWVVRKRWLRPVVPILVSPLVALYCRARRTLKKRGVSRRRWACSLCRRRARWKCVRCLRSYYCSRQCQNVSWHIVHKHVCYKPVRFWWSVAIYTMCTFLLVPRLLQNFPIYDAMVTLLPINFIALGIVGGGIASSTKRSLGIDIRGRILEIIVVVLTLLLTLVSSGLVRGYFGDASRCWGASSSWPRFTEQSMLGRPFHLPLLNNLLIDIPLRQLQKWYQKWDFILSKFGFVSRRFICAPTPDGNTDYFTVGCSPSTRSINPQFYLEDDKCTADMSLVVNVWIAAIGVLLIRNLTRQLRGARRNIAVAAEHRRPHQHQD